MNRSRSSRRGVTVQRNGVHTRRLTVKGGVPASVVRGDYPQYHPPRMARDRPAPPLAQAIERYLDWQALDRGRSPNTVRAYGIDLAGFLAFAGAAGVDQLAGVDRDLLREFQVAMARGGRGAKPLSPQTRHRRLVALRSFLRFCAREDWTQGDLGVAIDLPKLPKRLPKPLQRDEIERVTAPDIADLTEADLRDRALVAFLVSTGCRISEALQLDRADWNRERVVVRGKGDIERAAMITGHARDEVEGYLAARADDAPPLFLSYSRARPGQRLTVRGAEDVCTRLGVAHGVTKRHPHRLRQTAGTIVQEELGDPRLTAEFLGHHGLGSVAG
jgi:integrase/recombinase XerD